MATTTTQTDGRTAPQGDVDDDRDGRFCCPRCAGATIWHEKRLRCTRCQAVYITSNDIIDFRYQHHDQRFADIPRDKTIELLRDTKRQPWLYTLRQIIANINKNTDKFSDLVIDSNYAWKLLLRLPGNARVLDFGSGLGNLATNLAPHIESVIILNPYLEQLEFTKRRLQHFGLERKAVIVAGGDGDHLPFPENSFDCVTIPGKLQEITDDNAWNIGNPRSRRPIRTISHFFGASNSRAVQVRFLKEIRRVLKPDGQVFIAAENRFSYEYFGRKRDAYSGLWFISLLPRFLANLYSCAITRHPYHAYTYSARGYRRLLKAGGLPIQEFYAVYSGLNHLSELRPIVTKRQHLWHLPKLRGRNRIKRGSTFTPTYGIVASKEAVSTPAILESVFASIETKLQTKPQTSKLKRLLITSKAKGIAKAQIGGTDVIVKLPLNESAATAAARNHSFIQQATINKPELSQFIPQAMDNGDICGIKYYAESQIKGKLLKHALTSDTYAGYLRAVSNFLRALNPRIEAKASDTLADNGYDHHITEPLDQLNHYIDQPRLVGKLHDYFNKQLNGIAPRHGIVHGDLAVSNIFVKGDDISGVVDWDDIELNGIPILDSINYIHSAHRCLVPDKQTTETIIRLATWERLDKNEQNFLTNSYHRCNIDPSYHIAFVCLYWLRHITSQLDGYLIYDVSALEQRATRVFKALLDIT